MKLKLVRKLADMIGNDWVVTRKEGMVDYLMDETALTVPPKPTSDVVVVKPNSPQEMSCVLKPANEWKIPFFSRGEENVLVGGPFLTERGLVLSLERMNRVIEVDRENLMVVVETGVKLESLANAADGAGLLFQKKSNRDNEKIKEISYPLVLCDRKQSDVSLWKVEKPRMT